MSLSFTTLHLATGLCALAFCVLVLIAAGQRAKAGPAVLGTGLLLEASGHLLLAGLGLDGGRLVAATSGGLEALYLSCLMRAVGGLTGERVGSFWLIFPAATVAAAHLLLPASPAGALIEAVILILQGKIMLHGLIRRPGRAGTRGRYLVMAGLLLNTVLLATRGALSFRIWMEGAHTMSDFALLQNLGALGIVCVSLVASGFILCAKEASDENASLPDDTDPLTRCWTRPKILEMALAETRRFRRYGQSFSLVVIDLDHFRQIGESCGSAVAEAVLRELAHRIRAALRETDSIGRWGDDEFIVVLPATPIEEARLVAGRIREAAASGRVAGLRLSVSIGMSACRPDESFYECFLRADMAAFQATSRGGDRIVMADGGSSLRPRPGEASSASA